MKNFNRFKDYFHSLCHSESSTNDKLVEDPDHMMELGQYYAEFKQYDEAIGCFSWEMELHPADTFQYIN